MINNVCLVKVLWIIVRKLPVPLFAIERWAMAILINPK
jgi:hypothetical protein